MTPLFIIPARGGSKGIPRKNIKLLGGKPLIAYTIDVAKKLACDTDHIIMSTDDNEIAQVAKDCGIDVKYMRPASLATDTAGSQEVMVDAMNWADAQEIKYDCVVLLQPTSPFRTAEDVKACIEMYTDEIDMVVSVKEASCNPYYNCFEADENGYLKIAKGDGTLVRRQDAPLCYEYTGAVYVLNPSSVRTTPMGRFEKRIPVVMPSERSVDLDTPIDWEMAELLIKNKPE